MICDLATYRELTHDNSSYDGDVTVALEAAQRYVEFKTQRFFEKAERTEPLTPYSNGRVYPSALPLVSVSLPESAVIDEAAIITSASWIDNTMWAVASPWSGPGDDGGEGLWGNQPSASARVLVTYVGGYESTDMPEDIVEAVAEIARIKLLRPIPANSIPVGVTSIKVGDVSIAGTSGLSQYDSFPSAVKDTLRTWKRKTP